MRDGNLRSTFRKNLPHFFWATIESYTEDGIADSYYCRDGVGGWIEFKKTDANKVVSLTEEQVAWHARLARKGGRSHFIVRRGEELFIFFGGDGRHLVDKGIAGALPLGIWNRPWDWAEIEHILLSP